MKNFMLYFIGMFLGIGIFVVTVAGCSIITPPTYHDSEYSNYIDIAVAASEGICNSDETQKLAALSTRAGLYSKYLPNNELITQGAEQMDKSIQTLRANDAPSKGYCQMKLRVIKQMATTLAEAAGGKPR
jgi:hypothetical protein